MGFIDYVNNRGWINTYYHVSTADAPQAYKDIQIDLFLHGIRLSFGCVNTIVVLVLIVPFQKPLIDFKLRLKQKLGRLCEQLCSSNRI